MYKRLLFVCVSVVFFYLAKASGLEISFPSVSTKRNEFSAMLYEARRPRAIVVFLHGGGCTMKSKEADLSPRAVIDYFNRENLSFLVPNYRQNLDWQSANAKVPSLISKSECAEAVQIHLEDIKNLLNQLPQKVSNLPIFLMGVSYGGYLANYLAADRDLELSGVISVAGVWDPEKIQSVDRNLKVSTAFSPVKNSSRRLAKILVVHAKDDDIISFKQLHIFSSWARDHAEDHAKKFVISEGRGGHNASFTVYSKEVRKFIDMIVD